MARHQKRIQARPVESMGSEARPESSEDTHLEVTEAIAVETSSDEGTSDETSESVIYTPTEEEVKILTLSPKEMGYAVTLDSSRHLPVPPPPKQCRGDALGEQSRTLIDIKGRGITYNVGWTIPNEIRHKHEGNAQQYLIEFVNGEARVPEDVAKWYMEQQQHDPGRYVIN